MRKEIIRNTEEFFSKFPVSFDHDGVIADTRTLVVNEINDLFNTNYIATDIRNWNWVYDIALKHGLKEKDALSLDMDLWYNPDTLFKAPVLEGAYEELFWFYSRGIEPPIITSRNSKFRESTFSWYEEHLPFVNRKTIFIRENEELNGEIFKVFGINFFNTSFHFDDSVDQTRFILDNSDTHVALLSNSRILDDRTKLIRLPGFDELTLPNMVGANQKVFDRFNH